jgi:hypothetical protein
MNTTLELQARCIGRAPTYRAYIAQVQIRALFTARLERALRPGAGEGNPTNEDIGFRARALATLDAFINNPETSFVDLTAVLRKPVGEFDTRKKQDIVERVVRNYTEIFATL